MQGGGGTKVSEMSGGRISYVWEFEHDSERLLSQE